ncbi:helix-turn-helix transcriptional regulator [Caenimonas aquaedulcis]|uniref:LuxR family transcriptional regulator n=1 Tax=Caenimonas aquaedulcis TaxID=2793270 RepID=A0A931H4Y9_9BURK|nr:LuxR C-terminal-related transcriptional regulator [Caenimonas aquaedulcis]MBG9388515.1 LuxR family transcriptional regulator [Caenimonas aquaedulcis]
MDMLVEAGDPVTAFAGDADPGLSAGLAYLVDELAHGVIVATTQGRMLHASQPARHELSRRRILFISEGRLMACTPEGAHVLQEALAKVAEGKRSLVELVAPSGPGLTLALLPLKGGSSRSPRAAILLARASVCDSLMLCFFARNHGLTSTEEQVLGILCQGSSAPQVAQQLKVAVSTVRSHVRSMCAKTRSSGVRELINRVAVLPPIAPPFRHEPMH